MTDIADRPAVTAPSIGQSIRRKEDGRLLTGTTNWTDNIQLPGTLHMQIVRSPYAHAKITRIDFTAALAMPGVVAAFGADDLGADNAKVICVWPVVEDIVMPDFPALAVGEVRHVGDCVAVVLATERYLAADAVEAIEVDYEPLPAVVDMEAALAAGSPLVHSSAGTNHCYTKHYVCGDYEKAAADSRCRGQAAVRPAAADPVADGDQGHCRLPDGHQRGADRLDVDPDPARACGC